MPKRKLKKQPKENRASKPYRSEAPPHGKADTPRRQKNQEQNRAAPNKNTTVIAKKPSAAQNHRPRQETFRRTEPP